MRWPSSLLAQTGILLASAGICALISNGTAGPARRLGWGDQPLAAMPISTAAAIPAPQPLPMPQPIPPSAQPATMPSATMPSATMPSATMPSATKPLVTPKPPAPPSRPLAADRFAADPAQPIREISPEDVWALYQAKIPFLDARRSGEYAEGHIAGAWNVSVWESTVDTQITEFEAIANPGSTTPLVLYCSGGDCEDSHLLAARLTPLGYRNLLIYRAGYPDWVKQGRPIGKGAR